MMLRLPGPATPVPPARSPLGAELAAAPDGRVAPARSERFVTLPNGETIRVRPIRPVDVASLIALCSRLSPRTIYHRFFTVRALRPADAAALASVDNRGGVAIVADAGLAEPNDLVGVAQYGLASDDSVPDVGLLVEDAWQAQGLGPVLLNHLLGAGEARGFVTFRADVLAENRRMLRLLAQHVDIVQRTADHGVITILFRRLATLRHEQSHGE